MANSLTIRQMLEIEIEHLAKNCNDLRKLIQLKTALTSPLVDMGLGNLTKFELNADMKYAAFIEKWDFDDRHVAGPHHYNYRTEKQLLLIKLELNDLYLTMRETIKCHQN
jgi:hypothetical protein